MSDEKVRYLFDDVVLAWLVAPRQKNTLSAAIAALQSMFHKDPDATKHAIEAAIGRLNSKGFIAPRKALKLSDAGRQAALKLISLQQIPPDKNWVWIKKAFLLRSLGLPVTFASIENAGQTNWLAAQLLAHSNGIAPRPDLTIKEVMDTLQVRAFTGTSTETVQAPAVTETSSPTPPLPPLQGGTSPTAKLAGPTPQVALERFADHVKEAALATPTGRWLENKVFISHVYEEMKRRNQGDVWTPEDFKKQLVQAHHARLVRLNRADVVDALPPEDVLSSKTDDGDRTFHFVRIDRREHG